MNRRTLLGASAALSAALFVGASVLPASAGMMEGNFEGRSNHVTTGSAAIIEENGRYFVELGENFSLDGGPDPRVSLGVDGVHDPDTILGALLSLTGQQRYALPPTLDASKYNTVVIWCEVAGVPLGVAAVK